MSLACSPFGAALSARSLPALSEIKCRSPPRGPVRLASLSLASTRKKSRILAAATLDIGSGDLFPGGTRRASVRLPGLGLKIRTEEVLDVGEAMIKGKLDSAVAAGVNIVILEDTKEESLRLYEAARILMTILRGRAQLLVSERVDIASAANADGVLLSDQGLPSVVARKMMQNAMPDAVVLPLVARRVSTSRSAEIATITEGADVLMLPVSGSTADAARMLESMSKSVKVPVFVESGTTEAAPELFEAGADGLVLSSLPKSPNVSSIESSTGFPKVPVLAKNSAATVSLQEQVKRIIQEERDLLSSAVDIIRDAAPDMGEVMLLVETIKKLDDPFLLVVVGEFNSGKSSVINALLGGEFLRQGILPTTNEITLLKFADEDLEAPSDRNPDGHLTRYLHAQLLKQMNLVDTPGTNVILQRQQRLTEEFVPRADLIMFIIGVERPLTESEVAFLRYIRKWDKKIIFAVNKTDLLSDSSEVAEVVEFVKNNVSRLLNIDSPVVYPISARKALQAKRLATESSGTIYSNQLAEDPLWRTSGFDDLEEYVLSFLGGSSEAGAERIRLKLGTPLGVAVALISACLKKLEADAARIQGDIKLLAKLQEQFERYEDLLANNADMQMQRVTTAIAGATARALDFVDRTLQLSNVDAVSKYLLPRRSVGNSDPVLVDREIIGPAFWDIRRVVEDHRFWMISNSQRQLEIVREASESRWPGTNEDHQLTEPSKRSMEALETFDVAAANAVLEQELRDAVFSTFGSLGIAGASASFLTSVLPTTLEDLLALAICSAGGLASVFKLPSLRAKVKTKVKRTADTVAQSIRDAMREEANEVVGSVKEAMDKLIGPYRRAVETESNRISSLQSRLLVTTARVEALRQSVRGLDINTEET